MRYALLIYGAEADQPADGSPEAQQVFQDYVTYTQELRDSGAMSGGEALQPIATATSVRVRNGETLVTDGPFADTKEQLGGFYLVDCPDLDAAIAWAARIPGARRGTIEVRPIVEFGG